MKLCSLVFASAALFLVPFAASAQTPTVIAAGPVEILPAAELAFTEAEVYVLSQAARFGFEQVILGQNASLRSTDPRVRAFAQSLASTWADETWNVRALGRRGEASLPKRVATSQRDAIAALERHPNEIYDRAFVTLVAREHEALLGLVAQRALRKDQRAVRQWAERLRPILTDTLKTARQLEKDLTPPAG